jgi:hypothetical protein
MRARFTCTTKSRTPMVNGQRPFLLGEILLGKSAIMLLHISCNTNPEPRISDATCQHPMVRPKAVTPVSHSVLGTHLATSSSGFRGSRIRDANFLGVENPEMPNPDIRDLLPRVPPWIDGSRYFGKSQLGTSRGIDLLYHKTPNAETPKLWIRATCPAMIDGSGRFGKSPVAIPKSLSSCLAECRTPTPQGSCATCPFSDRRLGSLRDFGTRDFTRCKTLVLPIPELRNSEVRWTLTLHACGRGYLPRSSPSIRRSSGFRKTSLGFPTVDSLSPAEFFAAPPSSRANFTGVSSRNETKELPLLSFVLLPLPGILRIRSRYSTFKYRQE